MSPELNAVAAIKGWPRVEIKSGVTSAATQNVWWAECACGNRAMSVVGPVTLSPHLHPNADGVIVYVAGGLEIPL